MVAGKVVGTKARTKFRLLKKQLQKSTAASRDGTFMTKTEQGGRKGWIRISFTERLRRVEGRGSVAM